MNQDIKVVTHIYPGYMGYTEIQVYSTSQGRWVTMMAGTQKDCLAWVKEAYGATPEIERCIHDN